MMSAKLAALSLKIKVFWNNGYNAIISVHEVTNKILSRVSNYIADAIMWPKFGNHSISMRQVIIISIWRGFDRKNDFFLRGDLDSSSIIAIWYGLEMLHRRSKRVKTKNQKVLELIPTFVEVTGEKMVKGWNRVILNRLKRKKGVRCAITNL